MTLVIIVGNTNVGKSTIFNRLIGYKRNSVSNKHYTTRSNLTICVDNICYTDTAGIIYGKTLMNYDVSLFVVKYKSWTDQEEHIAQDLVNSQLPTILLMTRVDTLYPKNHHENFIQSILQKVRPLDYYFVSGKHGHNLCLVQKRLATLPHSAVKYESNIISRDIKGQIKEIVREKIMRLFHQEIPYSIKVEIEMRTDTVLVRLLVSTSRHLPIVIGTKGAKIRTLRSMIQSDMTKLLSPYKKLLIRVSDSTNKY